MDKYTLTESRKESPYLRLLINGLTQRCPYRSDFTYCSNECPQFEARTTPCYPTTIKLWCCGREIELDGM